MSILVVANPYTAVALNLTKLDVNCTSSNASKVTSSCSILGDIRADINFGTGWIRQNENTNDWVTIQWNSYLDVIAVSFWNRLERPLAASD